MGEIPFIGFLRRGINKVFRMHRLMHSVTDGQTRKQNTFRHHFSTVAEI